MIERRWFVLKRPRCDTHGGSETEVTVTRTSRESKAIEKEKRRLHPLVAQAETQDQKTVLRHGGALPREAESEGGRRPECQG